MRRYDGVDKKTRLLADRSGIVNVLAFRDGRSDCLDKKFFPPENKHGVPPLTTIEYCLGWVSVHNEGSSKLAAADFSVGYYDGRTDVAVQRTSDSYKTGYALGQDRRSASIINALSF